MSGLVTGGAPAITGKHNGLSSIRLKDMDHLHSSYISLYCPPRTALCKTLNLKGLP